MIYPGLSVTNVVLVICLAVFLRILFSQDKTETAIRCGAYDRTRIAQGQWWRLFTVGFVHIQVWHFIMNMYSLTVFASLERVIGPIWFAIILFVSIFGGSIVQYNLSDARLAVGLSGGLYGLMTSYLLLILLYGSVNPRSLIYMIVVNLLINLSPNVAWQAHLGGAVTGLALTVCYLVLH